MSSSEKIFRALQGASRHIDEIIEGLSKGRSLEELKESIWRSYELCEYAAGLMKLKIPELHEIAGQKNPPSSNDLDLLVYAQDRIDEVTKASKVRAFERVLPKVRAARDSLKVVALKMRGANS